MASDLRQFLNRKSDNRVIAGKDLDLQNGKSTNFVIKERNMPSLEAVDRENFRIPEEGKGKPVQTEFERSKHPSYDSAFQADKKKERDLSLPDGSSKQSENPLRHSTRQDEESTRQIQERDHYQNRDNSQRDVDEKRCRNRLKYDRQDDGQSGGRHTNRPNDTKCRQQERRDEQRADDLRTDSSRHDQSDLCRADYSNTRRRDDSRSHDRCAEVRRWEERRPAAEERGSEDRDQEEPRPLKRRLEDGAREPTAGSDDRGGRVTGNRAPPAGTADPNLAPLNDDPRRAPRCDEVDGRSNETIVY